MSKGLAILTKVIVGGVVVLYMYAMMGLGYDEASRTHESIEETTFDEMFDIGLDIGRRAREGWKWAFKN